MATSNSKYYGERVFEKYVLNCRLHPEIMANEKHMAVFCLSAYQQSFKCKQCGQCCKTQFPIVFDIEEMKDMARHLDMSVSEFRKLYVEHRVNGLFHFKQPCPLLKNNVCIVYPERPLVCRNFPFLTGENVKNSTKNGPSIAVSCPNAWDNATKMSEIMDKMFNEVRRLKNIQSEKGMI